MSFAFALLVASTTPVVDAVLDPGRPGASCGCCPAPCADRIDGGLLTGDDCRDVGWSCFDDPAASCAALLWTPVRVSIAVLLVPLLLMKPKCDRPLDVDIESLGAAIFFGQPLARCTRPRPPPDAPQRRHDNRTSSLPRGRDDDAAMAF